MEDVHVQSTDAPVLRLGRKLVDWEIDEYPQYKRSKRWYVVAGLIATACLVYAIATANFLFAVIILMLGVITLVTSFQEPDRVPVVITSTGVVIGDDYYAYKSIKDFSIIYDPPVSKVLYIAFQTSWTPMLAVPLEDVDPALVRDSLLPYVAENLARSEERLTDLLRKVYKF